MLLARENDATHGIHDLLGKKSMIKRQSAELKTYLRQERITPDRICLLEHRFN